MRHRVWHTIFITFCSGSEIFQKRAPVHSKTTAFSMFRVYQYYLVVALKQRCIEETAH